MAKFADCGSETEPYSSGVPVCLKCSDLRETKRKVLPTPTQDIRTILLQDLLSATARNSEAIREFEEVSGQADWLKHFGTRFCLTVRPMRCGTFHSAKGWHSPASVLLEGCRPLSRR